jgi:predicted nuclease of predicted toxin-antitoxin system
MRFLVDECTGSAVVRWLRGEGHEVFSVYDEARGIDDDEVLHKAFDEDRILITNDKDFGEKVFREQRQHNGIILLRLDDERSNNKIEMIRKLLEMYSSQLANQFVVVSESQVRLAKA